MVSEPSCDHALYIDVLQPVGPCIPGVKPRSCPKPWSLPVSPAIRAEWLKVKQRGKPRSFPISPREKQMWKEALKQGRQDIAHKDREEGPFRPEMLQMMVQDAALRRLLVARVNKRYPRLLTSRIWPPTRTGRGPAKPSAATGHVMPAQAENPRHGVERRAQLPSAFPGTCSPNQELLSLREEGPTWGHPLLVPHQAMKVPHSCVPATGPIRPSGPPYEGIRSITNEQDSEVLPLSSQEQKEQPLRALVPAQVPSAETYLCAVGGLPGQPLRIGGGASESYS